MFGIGMPEMIVILLVALIVVGPKKLPDLAKTLAKGLNEFRKATDDIKDQLNENETFRDIQGLQREFRETVDSVNPKKYIHDAVDAASPKKYVQEVTQEFKEAHEAILEPKEPQLNLQGRAELYEQIEQERVPAAENQAAAQTPASPESPGSETTQDPPQPKETARNHA